MRVGQARRQASSLRHGNAGGARVCSASRADAAHEVGCVELQARREPHDRAQPRVSKPALEARDLGHVHAAAKGQLHLRQASRLAEPPEVLAQLLLRLHGQPSSSALGQSVQD
jgi:hypothetical protein